MNTMTTTAHIAPLAAAGRQRGSHAARMARALKRAWRGAVIEPLHGVLDRHARLAGLEPLNAATLRDLGMR